MIVVARMVEWNADFVFCFRFMYSNVYGQDGVERLISLMKQEIIADAGNLGIGNLSEINPSYVSHAPAQSDQNHNS